MVGWWTRNRTAVLLAAVASALIVAAVGGLLVMDEARVKSIPGLAVAVFGTFLTSMAIIAAFSVEERSRWPTPWEALDRAHVPVWFTVALASVVTALLSGALDSSFLSAFSLALALVAVPLGAWGLWGLIALSSEQGRWRLVVDLLARSILRVGDAEREAGPDLGEIETEDHVPVSFLASGAWTRPGRTGVAIDAVPDVMREYADRRDLEALVRLVGEVHAGARKAFAESDSLTLDAYLGSVDRLLQVQRGMFGDLAGRVLSGQLGDATARIALARAGEAILDTAGRARRWEGATGQEDLRRVERLVARHLTAVCRLAGWVAGQAGAQLRQPRPAGAGSAERAPALALRTTCTDLQQAVRWAVDNDPPGMKIPPDHVWRSGLSDPESALGWLWSTAEAETGPLGVGLYAVCEILTQRKFFESYWDGFDVFTTIERRLYGEVEGPTATEASRVAIERAGGLPLLSLELAAARLSAAPARATAEAFGDDMGARDSRHVACDLFLAGAGYKPRGRDPVADLAWLLTDRLRGSLWTTVFEQLAKLPDPVLSPPMRPLHRHPAAVTLAVCLRLVPLRDEGDADSLAAQAAFVAQLPDPLLDGAAALALELTSAGEAVPPGTRRERERSLIEATMLAREVTPGPLPEQDGATAAGLSATVRAEPVPGFEGVAERIAAAGTELEIDLIQSDRRWLDEWADARAELDAALLAAALRGVARVRRIVPFGLPGDADRDMTRLQYRWTESLSAAVGCFSPSQAPGPAPPYEVRQVVIPSSAESVVLPADCLAIRGLVDGGSSIAERQDRFDDCWDGATRDAGGSDFGLIELGGSAGRGTPRSSPAKRA